MSKQPLKPTADDGDQAVPARRADWVMVDLKAYEAQRADEARWQAYLRELDPDGYGHWNEDDE